MKNLALAFMLFLATGKSFALTSFLTSIQNEVFPLWTTAITTTTSSMSSVWTGVVIFADNGEAFIDVGSEEAKDILRLAVQKSVDGEELNYDDFFILDIYSQYTGLSQAELIETVASEL